MFGSLFDVVTDVVRVVAAPVQIAVNVVSVPVKAVADVAQGVAKEVNQALKD